MTSESVRPKPQIGDAHGRSIGSRRRHKRLVLIAMIFAVAMMFIDQTIVALAVPELQKDLSLSSTGAQWIVNGYLLALSALFAFGGKLADVLGHRRMVMVGVTGFAAVSALCGATPTGVLGEAWMIVFRVLQGASAAVLFPAALAIVVAAFPVARARPRARRVLRRHRRADRGRPARRRLPDRVDVARDLLDQHPGRDHRAGAHRARRSPRRSARTSRSTTAARCWSPAAMGLVVLGLQQAGVWGWTDVRTIGCIVVGAARCSPGSCSIELRTASR